MAEKTAKTKTKKFQLRPPGVNYPLITWATPFVTETLSGIALVFMPLIVGLTIDRFSQGNTSGGWQLVTLLISLVLFLSVNEKIGWGTLIRTQVKLERDWRHHTASLLPGLGSQGDPGSIIATMNKDTKAIAAVIMAVNQACGAFAVAIFGTIQLIILKPSIAIAALTGVGLTIYLLTLISKTLEKRAETFRDKIGTNTSKASDIATSIRTIVGLGASHTMMGRYTQSAHDVRAAQLRYERVHSWSASARTFLVGSTTMIATALALRGQTLNGTWATDIPASQLITVTGIVGMMTGPIWVVENFLRMYRDGKVAYRRIQKLETTATSPAPTPSALSLQEEAALRTTLNTQATIHYINPRTHGQTAQDYAQALAATLRANPHLVHAQPHDILLSEPNPMIFAGTLWDHLTLGAPTPTPEEADYYLQATDSTEIAHRLGGPHPHTYWQATISAEGTNLSGGQRQRLALARAYAQKKPVLILTEPVNSVDEPSQQYIYNHLEAQAGQPGPLAHLTHVFIISTTLEADRRITKRQEAPRG